MKIVVTGAAGFIGMHVAQLLLARGDEVLGIDSLNHYYDPALKQARLATLQSFSNFTFAQADIAEPGAVHQIFQKFQPERVVHLAAQAGVRYSIDHPDTCIQNNIVAFGQMLEACRHHEVQHLVYASSSSVYGANVKMPYSPQDSVDHPVSLYAASKKANELMAHTYSHLFGLPTTGLRYFTVYGPWGRPDMSPWLFSQAIMNDRPIKVFNHGQMERDFTFIDDIAQGSVRVLDRIATPCATQPSDVMPPDQSHAPYRVYNIGNQTPVKLLEFIQTLESALGKKAQLNMQPMQAGDVLKTAADTSSLTEATGYQASTLLSDGLTRWARWYLDIGHQFKPFGS